MDLSSVDMELVDGAREGSLLLRATDAPRFIWRIRVRPTTAAAWEVYLTCNQTRICPKTHLHGDGRLFIGLEQGIFILKGDDGSLVGQIPDICYFQSFDQVAGGMLLATAELEVIAFGPESRVLWRTAIPDVLESLELRGDVLVLRDMAGVEYVLDLATGDPRGRGGGA